VRLNASNALAGGKSVLRKDCFAICSAKLHIEVLQKAGVTKEWASQEGLLYEADNRRPPVGFALTVADLNLDRQISANNGTATDNPNIPLIGTAKIQPDRSRDQLGEDRVVGACI
jgi:hypothetical protein